VLPSAADSKQDRISSGQVSCFSALPSVRIPKLEYTPGILLGAKADGYAHHAVVGVCVMPIELPTRAGRDPMQTSNISADSGGGAYLLD
jgi:hypothetical protein